MIPKPAAVTTLKKHSGTQIAAQVESGSACTRSDAPCSCDVHGEVLASVLWQTAKCCLQHCTISRKPDILTETHQGPLPRMQKVPEASTVVSRQRRQRARALIEEALRVCESGSVNGRHERAQSRFGIQ